MESTALFDRAIVLLLQFQQARVDEQGYSAARSAARSHNSQVHNRSSGGQIVEERNYFIALRSINR